MPKNVTIVMIHGMGNQGDAFWRKRTPYLAEAIERRRLKARFIEVKYADIARDAADKYWDSIRKRRTIRADKLRKIFIDGFADAGVYGYRPELPDSNYRHVHQRINDAILLAMEDLAEGEPVVIRAHSLGCHIISNYLYDMANGTGAHANGALKPIDDFRDRLKLLITSGNNIPLFVAGLSEKEVFPKLGLQKWLNIYDRHDFLGWPIKPLGSGFNQQWIDDEEIDSGWIHDSHLDTWFDDGVNERIASEIETLLT